MKNPEDLPPPTRRELAIALGLLYGGTFALFGLALVVPGISGSLQAFLAAILLVAPTIALRGTGVTIDDCGVQMGPWRRTAAASAATMGIVFAAFAGGYHVFQTALMEATPRWELDAIARWDDAIDGAPSEPCSRQDGRARVFIARGGLWVLPAPGQALKVRLGAPPSAGAARAVRCQSDPDPVVGEAIVAQQELLVAPRGAGVWVPLADQRHLEARVVLDGKPADRDALALGPYGDSPDSDGVVRVDRGFLWLLVFLVVHLGLVALPEEWFFRGYLQARLDRLLGTPWRLFGAPLGWGFVLAALAFALLHPILVPGVHRLAVFFPALLFGWLRARTGTIGAAVVVHAGANLLQAVISRMYV